MLQEILTRHIEFIYPDQDASTLVAQFCAAFDLAPDTAMPRNKGGIRAVPSWSEDDSFLITYGDTILSDDCRPLQNTLAFLNGHLKNTVSGVHILPFFPFTSDDGFAVSDYDTVRPDLGDWDDIGAIGKGYRLMSDVVINHASAGHRWFQQFLEDKPPGRNFIKTAALDDDISQVTRPRPSPLLYAHETDAGEKWVWCTFGPDQIDLDFSNPDLLCEFIRLLRFYIDKGVRVFRLDAVGFLWKQSGTNCLHLQETHEIVKLMRTLIDHLDDNIWLITETNVPAHENLEYFGNSNEAHLIYNFALPPLLVHALLTGRSSYLRRWMMSTAPTPDGCTMFNFSASHDGIGLRPVEGLLPPEEISCMSETVQGFGGRLTMRSYAGRQVPYEINTTLFSALRGTVNGPDAYQVDRFLASQTIMMSLEGIPAFYVQSFLASENDEARATATGRNRSLNRTQWRMEDIDAKLAADDTPMAQVFSEMLRRVAIRKKQKAFHPDATQFTLHIKSGMFGFWRLSLDRRQSLFVVTNMTDKMRVLNLRDMNLYADTQWVDLLSGTPVHPDDEELELAPYQTVWITNRSS
ncbi:sugar phosphorylase [Alphaproteobacteria bacterium]|nr:sugar phosphorylase [Alphaproteobacteria bacterium]MDB2523502.1 sugar phosphorylase [Alphaproteobacteria bacterium]